MKTKTCESNTPSVSQSNKVRFVNFLFLLTIFERRLHVLRIFKRTISQSLFHDITGEFLMQTNAKHGGGERAGHCGRDEGPLQCGKCAERLPETRVEILLHHSDMLHYFNSHCDLPVRKHILQWFVKTTFESFNFFSHL